MMTIDTIEIFAHFITFGDGSIKQIFRQAFGVTTHASSIILLLSSFTSLLLL